MLLDLNSYCIEHILKYLNLTDHLVISQVHPILKEIIKNKFERKFKSGLIVTPFWQNQPFRIPPYLNYIINNATETIEYYSDEMHAIQDSLERLEFNRVKCIILDGDHIRQEHLIKLRIIIPQLFPNFKILKIRGHFNQVTHVFIDDIEEIEVYTKPCKIVWNLIFRREIKKLTFHVPFHSWIEFKAKMINTALEELKLCMSDYVTLHKYVKFNTVLSLRKLTIKNVTDDIELTIDEEIFYKSIDSIAFNIKTCPTMNTKFVDLQRLLFVNDNGNMLKEFCKIDTVHWHKLEYICYLRTSNDSNIEVQKTNLLYMVRHCPILEMLDISGSKFDVDFIKSLSEVLASQPRLEKLLVYCFNTNIPKNFECEQIIFSFEELDYILPDEEEIEIQLNRNKRLMDCVVYLQKLELTRN